MSDHKSHFGGETAAMLANTIVAVYPAFDVDGYVTEFKPIKLRKYYPGTHQIDIVINGLTKSSTEFELLPA